MRTLCFPTSIVLLIGATAPLHAHSDILVSQTSDGTKLITGGYEFGGAPGGGNLVITPPVRVFGYEFGENPADPFFAEDPGIVALPGTFAVGTSFYFDVQDELKYWDGAGAVAFGAVPSGESLLLSKGTPHVTVGSGGSYPLSGLHIGNADGSAVGQQLHEHLDVYLLGSDGNAVPADSIYDLNPPYDLLVQGDGVEAASGIYLLALTLRTTTPGVSPSEPFWIVYNAGMSEDVHDAAMMWTDSHLAPEPHAALLLCIGGAVTRAQRRRPH